MGCHPSHPLKTAMQRQHIQSSHHRLFLGCFMCIFPQSRKVITNPAGDIGHGLWSSKVEERAIKLSKNRDGEIYRILIQYHVECIYIYMMYHMWAYGTKLCNVLYVLYIFVWNLSRCTSRILETPHGSHPTPKLPKELHHIWGQLTCRLRYWFNMGTMGGNNHHAFDTGLVLKIECVFCVFFRGSVLSVIELLIYCVYMFEVNLDSMPCWIYSSLRAKPTVAPLFRWVLSEVFVLAWKIATPPYQRLVINLGWVKSWYFTINLDLLCFPPTQRRIFLLLKHIHHKLLRSWSFLWGRFCCIFSHLSAQNHERHWIEWGLLQKTIWWLVTFCLYPIKATFPGGSFVGG